jgi:Niemann-Pick C1 protein
VEDRRSGNDHRTHDFGQYYGNGSSIHRVEFRSKMLTILKMYWQMALFGINLNAISLVNLVISCGISVEFCSHIARAFMGAKGGGVAFDQASGAKDRTERATAALVDVGASVFSGITATKLIGISVLGFTHSKLLEVYFFRQWSALIISGALHGLVFLPVFLSLQGGQGYQFDSDDQQWIDSSISNQYSDRSRPFCKSSAALIRL